MKKRILTILMAVLALGVLLSPMIGTVFANRGEERYSFKLLIQGVPSGDPFKVADGNTIYHDRTFTIAGDMYVEIGDAGSVDKFTKEYIEYEGHLYNIAHTKPEPFYSVLVIEIISIYDDDTIHDETTWVGDLELRAIGDNRGGHDGNFVGFGTGEFEGVKIQGTSPPLEVLPPVQLTRIGTVMGWPT
jgi:hypothetical protein